MGETIKEIVSLLGQLDDQYSDLGFDYNFPSAAEYKKATYQDYKRSLDELLDKTPIEAPHFYETKFKNINYKDFDWGKIWKTSYQTR